MESYGRELTSKKSNGQLSRITSVGRSVTEERQLDQEDSEDYGEHCTEKSSSCQTQSNPVDGLYTREEIDRLGAGLRSRKCRILDSVLKTIPDHLKAKAKIVCDALKFRDDSFINLCYELIIIGTLIQGSNICNLIINKVTHPTSTGSEQIKQVESEKKLLKYLLNQQTKALERERVVPICTKYESWFDRTDNDEDDDEKDDEDDAIEEDEPSKKKRK